MAFSKLETNLLNNIISFLYPYEQCKMIRLCKGMHQINVPLHMFDQDLIFWKENFEQIMQFEFSNVNVKDKITIVNMDNGDFECSQIENRMYLIYFLKYHLKISHLYQPKVEQILAKDIENYAGDFYKEVKFLYALNLSDNNSVKTMSFVVDYIGSMKMESKILSAKKCPLLKELFISGNCLTDEHIFLFCKAVLSNLKQWNNLNKLELSDNDFGDKHMEMLFNEVIVDKCNGLDYLGLESAALSDDTIDVIYGMCEKNPDKVHIKHLNLKFNGGISDDGEDRITNDAFKKTFPIIAKGMKISI